MATISEIFTQALSLASFSSELLDESNALFTASFKEQKDKIEPITSSLSVDFCVRKRVMDG